MGTKPVHEVYRQRAQIETCIKNTYHIPVHPLVQLPTLPRQRYSRDLLTRCRDWSCTSQCRKPDHDLVFRGSSGRAGREQIIRNICDEPGAGVRVRPCTKLTDLLVVRREHLQGRYGVQIIHGMRLKA